MYNEKVREFHTTFKQVINEQPTIPDGKTNELRLNLILEELTELAEAMGPEALNFFQRALFQKSQSVHNLSESLREKMVPSKVGCLDALCDLQYVLSGTIVAMGFAKNFDEAFEEVHNSNMSKACKNEVQAKETFDHYEANSTPCYAEEQPNGTFLIFRSQDKKILKSVYYTPANLQRFVEQTTEEVDAT